MGEKYYCKRLIGGVKLVESLEDDESAGCLERLLILHVLVNKLGGLFEPYSVDVTTKTTGQEIVEVLTEFLSVAGRSLCSTTSHPVEIK